MVLPNRTCDGQSAELIKSSELRRLLNKLAEAAVLELMAEVVELGLGTHFP